MTLPILSKTTTFLSAARKAFDTALIMAADTVAGYIQGLLDGVQFKRSSYALDRESRQAAMNRLFAQAMRPVEAAERLAA